MIKVVHYLNQFFAGVGGERSADVGLDTIEGAIGPGVALQGQFKDRAKILCTLYAGDNYATGQNELFLKACLEQLQKIRPDVIVAGPAFAAGRYGLACASLLKAAKDELDIPGVTGLSPENAALESYRRYIYAVPTTGSAAGMAKVLPSLARLALRLGERVELSSAREEGYLPRGIRKNVRVGVDAAERAVNLAIARFKGMPFQSELEIIPFDIVAPPPPIDDVASATIALVTEAGVVPAGNPDRLETQHASKWFHYPFAGDDLKQGEFEAWHAGFVTDKTNEDPDRCIPLDALRALEEEGVIGKLCDEFCVTCGCAGAVSSMRRLGQEIAAYLKEKLVSAAILTAT
jgi:betaine reductase